MKTKEIKAYARERLLGNYGKVIAARLLTVLMEGIIGALLLGLGLIAVAGIAGVAGERNLRSRLGFYLIGAAAVLAVLLAAGLVILFLLDILFSFGIKQQLLNIAYGREASVSDLFTGFHAGKRPMRLFTSAILRLLIAFGLILVYAIGLAVEDVALSGGLSDLAAFLGESLWTVIWTVLFLYIVLGFSLSDYIIVENETVGARGSIAESFRLMRGRRWKLLWLSVSFVFWVIPNYLSMGLTGLWVNPYITCSTVIFYLEAAAKLPPDDNGGEVNGQGVEDKADFSGEDSFLSKSVSSETDASVSDNAGFKEANGSTVQAASTGGDSVTPKPWDEALNRKNEQAPQTFSSEEKEREADRPEAASQTAPPAEPEGTSLQEPEQSADPEESGRPLSTESESEA